MRTATTRRLVAPTIAAMLVAILLAPPAEGARTVPDVGTYIVKTGDGRPSNVEVAVGLSQATPGPADVVVIGRDDVFADSLSSAFLQGQGPLMLVPPAGPLPRIVIDEISRVGASRAVLLGGENALAPAVADELSALGLAVTRRAGPTRLETAIAVAETDAAAATTAMLVRAFPSAGGPDSQAFADSLGAGAVAAANGWPVLLSQTEVLSDSTRAYLERSAITDVQIVGGTAAISADVEAELQQLGVTTRRIAGPDRFSTAVGLVREQGAESAADVARVVLVSGEGDDAWAAGFAAARHAAQTDGAIVLTREGSDLPPQPPGVAGAAPAALPDATQAWLDGGTFAGGDGAGLIPVTCVAREAFCEQGRQSLGFAPTPIVTFSPADVALQPGEEPTVQLGDTVTVTVEPQDRGPVDHVLLHSTCAPTQTGFFTFVSEITELPDLGCSFHVETIAPDGQRSAAIARYNCCPQPVEVQAPILISFGADGAANDFVTQEEAWISADGSCVAFTAQGDIGGEPGTEQGVHAFLYDVETGEHTLLDRRFDGTSAFNGATIHGIADDCSTVLIRPTQSLDDNADRTGLWLVPGSGGGITPTYVTVDQTGAEIPTSRGVAAPSLSGDGQVVVFSTADGLFRNHVGVQDVRFLPHQDVVLTNTGAVTLSATDVDGSSSAIESLSQQGERRIRLLDWTTETLQPLDRGPDGATLSFVGVPNRLVLSGDASWAVFDADTRDQPGGPPGGAASIYLADALSSRGQTSFVARNILGEALAGAVQPDISADGRWITFARLPGSTQAARVDAPGSQVGCGHWIIDRITGQHVRVDRPDLAFSSTCHAGAVVADTGAVVIVTDAPLDPADAGGGVDAYLLMPPPVLGNVANDDLVIVL